MVMVGDASVQTIGMRAQLLYYIGETCDWLRYDLAGCHRSMIKLIQIKIFKL
jgi:hypothetical protein